MKRDFEDNEEHTIIKKHKTNTLDLLTPLVIEMTDINEIMNVKNKYFRLKSANKDLKITYEYLFMFQNLHYEFGIKLKTQQEIWLLDKFDITYDLRYINDDLSDEKENKVFNNELIVPLLPSFKIDFVLDVIKNTTQEYVNDFEHFSLKLVQTFSQVHELNPIIADVYNSLEISLC